MPIVKCRICNNEFYVKPSHQKLGCGKYCSRTCQAKSQLKGIFVNCSICRKKAWKMPRELKHSKSGKFFCGKSCQTIWRNSIVYTGSNHPNWKGGTRSYRDRMLHNNVDKVCKRCGEKDIRLLSVHHIDENRKNNKIENLAWLCYNCHFLIHRDKEENARFMKVLV